MRKLLLALILLPVTISAQNNTNILLNNWPGNFGGLPPFDQIKISDFKSALEKGMEMNLAEMDDIANNPEAPTFENTIVQIGEVLISYCVLLTYCFFTFIKILLLRPSPMAIKSE